MALNNPAPQAAPPGKVAPFAQTTAPAGWLIADGAAVSRATYAALFAAIGTLYGVGDGATTFNLPDYRAEFLRGADQGRGIDAGRAVGSAQAGQMPAHTHGIRTNAEGGSGGITGNVRDNFNGIGPVGGQGTESAGGTANASENRPRNVAVLYCIKT